MARMHSRDKGKASSKKPFDSKPSWVRYKPKEIEMLITKLAKSGLTSSNIGLVLRDEYGIPDVKPLINKKIGQFLVEKKISKELPEDITALIKRSIALRKHLQKNKHDNSALHGLQLTDSKIHRLEKYYKKSKKLVQDWKYEPKRAELLLE